MSVLQQDALKRLRQARAELIGIPRQELTSTKLESWIAKHQSSIRAGGRIAGSEASAWNALPPIINSYRETMDTTILDAARDELVAHLDSTIAKVEGTETVRPALDELILKVSDTKLATLLNEFNACKDRQPNLAAIGFRTILCLIIRERAKLKAPQSELATRQDFSFQPSIKGALNDHIFDGAEEKLLDTYFGGGQKDIFDNIAHKSGDNALIDKPSLSAGVDNLLNKLLATVV